MRWLSKIGFYVKALFLRRRLDAQLSEEVRIHLDMAIEANVAAGMTPEAARRLALREFGNVAGFQERTRDERGWVWLEQLLKDFGFAWRGLLHARGFAITMVVTLFLGIGAALTVFMLADATLFRPLPYPDAEQLVAIGESKQDPSWPFCFPVQLQAYREQTNVFSEFAASRLEEKNVVVDGEPAGTTVSLVSSDFFRTLGITVNLGRTFLPAEYASGADNVVIISDPFWRKSFARSASVLGRTILIDEQPCVVVGVLPPRHVLPGFFRSDVLRPHTFTVYPQNPLGGHMVVARLRPGVSTVQACAELAAVEIDIHPTYAAYFSELEPRLFTLREGNRPHVLWMMVAGGGLLLAIATMNAANLMLVRVAGRRRELSVRLAIGARRWQVRWLLVAESLIISASVGGSLLLYLRWLYPEMHTWLGGFPLDVEEDALTGRTLALIAALVAFTGTIVTWVAGRNLADGDLHAGLKQGGNQIGPSRRGGRLRDSLVVLQATFAVILLSGAGLMIKTVRNLQNVDLGFDPGALVNVRVAFSRTVDRKWDARVQHFHRLRESLAALPGVTHATFGSRVLLRGGFDGILGVKMPDGTVLSIQPDPVSADFAETAGLRMMSGRWLSGKRSDNEVVINETLARTRFGAENPTGQFIEVPIGHGLPESWQIVGVVRDLRETVRQPPGMHVYFPEWFVPLVMDTVVLRFSQPPPPELTGLIKRAVHQTNPGIMAAEVTLVRDRVNQLLVVELTAYGYLRLLSGIALMLAVLGLFSVLASAVRQRRTEFGVRSALGATPGNLAAMVIKQGIALAAIGVAGGIIVALGLTRFMQSLLYETTPHDPWVFLGVASLLLLVAAFASWLPARRAARVDPATALRAE